MYVQRRTFLTTLAAVTAGAAGCIGGDDGGSSPDDPIHDMAAAIEDEDADALQDSYHPDSPEYPEDASFGNAEYEEVSVESTEVVEEDGDTAQVEAEISATVTFMGQTQSETTTSVVEVRKHEGEWLIWSEGEN